MRQRIPILFAHVRIIGGTKMNNRLHTNTLPAHPVETARNGQRDRCLGRSPARAAVTGGDGRTVDAITGTGERHRGPVRAPAVAMPRRRRVATG